MQAIRLRCKLESETLHLPELKPLVGKTVKITVQEESHPAVTPGTGDWAALELAASEAEGYDFAAVEEQRVYDLRHAEDHLP